MRSKGCGAGGRAAAFRLRKLKLVKPQRAAFFFVRVKSWSMNVTLLAPREAASRPMAPVPEKTSKTLYSASGFFSPAQRMLNNDSRARSEVGRMRPVSSGVQSFLPFLVPEIMRIVHKSFQAVLLRLFAALLLLRLFLANPAERDRKRRVSGGQR